MHMTSLPYLILICLCYPALRMPSKEQRKDMRSQILPMTERYKNETFEENKSNLKRQKHLKDYADTQSSVQTVTECLNAQEYISIDFCFIFLYYITSKRISTECILATTAIFFWKVSAFPVNCTDRTRETEQRKSRSVTTSAKFNRGDCEKDWYQFDETCYRVIQEIKNYKTATEHCTSLESELVRIQTNDQKKFIRSLANEVGVSGYLWTAVQKLCTNCTSGQPSGVSKCVTMNSSRGWKDFDCGYMFKFVCEKALSKTYTEKQLLIALLVPIFSCLTLAISFTTVLLVSSVRRVGQPFKLASRYARTKKKRKQTRLDVVDILRQASLQSQNGLKPRPSAPSIEITKPENSNGKILAKDADVKTPWYKRSNPSKAKNLHIPEERRRSSNTSSGGNSSLYELLARLNQMGIEPQNETTDNGIQLEEISGHKNGLKPGHIEDKIDEDHQTEFDDLGETSFQNMAFRDSVVSVETNGVAMVTSVQQVNQRDSIGMIEDIQDITSEASEHHQSSCDEDDRERTGTGNTQTVRADVHIANNEDIPPSNENVENLDRKRPCKGKVVWTYSL